MLLLFPFLQLGKQSSDRLKKKKKPTQLAKLSQLSNRICITKQVGVTLMPVLFPTKLPATLIQFEYFTVFSTDSAIKVTPLVMTVSY